MPDLFDTAPDANAREDSPADQLNPRQRDAVRHGEGPLLVVAGAGTGKTRVITERIRYLLESDPDLPGEAILGLTFTEKAAGEMKHRVTRAVGERGRAVCLGTFHAFCNALLVERNAALAPIEEVDHWVLLRRNLRVLELDRFRRLAEPGQFLGDFVKFFSRCQDELVTPDEYDRYVADLDALYARERDSLPEDERPLREETLAREREIARAYRASDRLLRERNRLTFGMQLMDAVHALDADPTFAEQLRRRFRYILVDEFQDTNFAQIELLWRLASDHRNIVAVGDNAQAIYRFRGASFSSFTIFLERFAGVPGGDRLAAARFLQPLIDNYRSTARILHIAGRVVGFLERLPLLPEHGLVPHKPQGEKVRVAEFASSEDEARWIAAEIERLHKAGRPWRGFAVLYRIHGHRQPLVEKLEERNIPFVIRNLSILDHPLLRDVLAYLRLLAKPADNVACARVLAAPAWALEPADLVRLAERAAKEKSSLWEALQSPQGELAFGGAANDKRHRIDEFVGGLADLRAQAKRRPAAQLFDELAEWLQISVAVQEGDRACVDRLAQFVREWQLKAERPLLSDFVEYFDYFVQAGGQINLQQEAGDAVQLMTVHAAKGLEFDHVFVLRLTQRGFPMAPRSSVLEFPEKLMKEQPPAGNYHTQEERRLFYVALTRAREQLTLTTVVHTRSKPSLFLEDIFSAPALARQHVERLVPETDPPSPARGTEIREGVLFPELRRDARVYSRIAEWALAYRPPVFEPLQLSPSAIDSYLSCPQKYLFGSLWGLRGGPHAATTFGNVMHTTIKHFIGALRKGRRLPFEEVEEIFRREWTSAGFEDSYQEECYQRDGIEQLRAFHASTLASPPDVMAQEKAFALELDHNVKVTGRMDQINRLGPDRVEIVDYKTGKPKSEAQARKDLQLGVYALAASEELELDPAHLVYYNLQTNERVSASREEKQLRVVRGTIQEVAADIRAHHFPPRPGFLCRICDFRTLCPAHEQCRSQSERADAEAQPATAAAPTGKPKYRRAKEKRGAV